jgi:hypothetical protein
MLKEKIGRVTFMPLNHLKPKSPTSNAPPAQDALPLMDKVRFGGFPPEDLSPGHCDSHFTPCLRKQPSGPRCSSLRTNFTVFSSPTKRLALFGASSARRRWSLLIKLASALYVVLSLMSVLSSHHLISIHVTILATFHFIVIAIIPCCLVTVFKLTHQIANRCPAL